MAKIVSKTLLTNNVVLYVLCVIKLVGQMVTNYFAEKHFHFRYLKYASDSSLEYILFN